MRSKYPVRIITTALLFLAALQTASAQAGGSVSVSGTVSPFVKLSSGGAATLTGNSGGGVTTESPSDSTLATIVNFGDVGPGNTSSYVCFTQPIFLRSNVTASMKAAVTAAAFAAGAASLQKSDIGLGFRNLSATGPNADVSSTTIVPAFSADPCTAPISVAGIPTFSATLNSLATAAPGTALLSTTAPWSLRGSANAASNRARVELKLAIVPQAFTVGSFSATVTLTVTSP